MISNSKRRKQEKIILTKGYYKANFEGSLKIDDVTYRANIIVTIYGDIEFYIYLNPDEFLLLKRWGRAVSKRDRMTYVSNIQGKKVTGRDYMPGIEIEKTNPIYQKVVSAFRKCYKTKKPVKLPEKITEQLKNLISKLQDEKEWISWKE